MNQVNTEAFRLAIHALLRQKKFLFALLVSLIPLAAGWLLFFDDASRAEYGADGFDWDPGLSELTSGVLISVSIPLMSLLLAGGLLADEAEERTLSYLLVRPVPRTILYASRAVAVLVVALPLAALQVLGLWLIRWVSYGQYASPGVRVAITETTSVSAVELMWVMLPAMLGVALLATLFYVLLFGAVSLITTRYHFFINLGYLGLWEGMLGHMPVGAQRLTATHHFNSMLEAADDTARLIWGADATAPWVSVPTLLAVAAIALAGSLVLVRHRDFHVTSAAT